MRHTQRGDNEDGAKTRAQLVAELVRLRAQLDELGGRTREQQKTLKQVAHSERLLRSLTGNALDSMAIMDARGRIVWYGPSSERLWGVPVAAPPERWNMTNVHPSQHRRLKRNLARTLRQPGVPVRGNYRVRAEDGAWRIVETVSTSFLYDPDVNGVVVNYRDITGRQMAQDRLKRSEAELRLLSGKILKVAEQERARIARELHDELGNELAFFQVKAAVLAEHMKDGTGSEQDVAELAEMAGRIQADCHRIVMSLGSTMVDDLGLVRSIEWLVEEFERRYRISCAVDTPIGDIPVDKDCAMAAYRIVQEALANVWKHARASEANVALAARDRFLLVTVADDGSGFDRAGIGVGKSLGLLSMVERSRLVGGTLKISSKPGRGTRIVARLPLKVKRPNGTVYPLRGS